MYIYIHVPIHYPRIYMLYGAVPGREEKRRQQRTCRHGSFVPGKNESESEEKKNGIVPVRGINKRWDAGGGCCRWPLCGEHRILCDLSYVLYTSVFVFVSANSHKRTRPCRAAARRGSGASPPNYLQPLSTSPPKKKEHLIT